MKIPKQMTIDPGYKNDDSFRKVLEFFKEVEKEFIDKYPNRTPNNIYFKIMSMHDIFKTVEESDEYVYLLLYRERPLALATQKHIYTGKIIIDFFKNNLDDIIKDNILIDGKLYKDNKSS